MTKDNFPTSITLSPETRAYLDWLKDNVHPRTTRSGIIEAILFRHIDLDKYPTPNDVKEELKKYMR